MNALELELDYPFGETLPEPGHTLEVAPGVRWIRMALPFALNHINLWLLADELDGVKGWTVVDCCIASDDAKALWEQIFATQLEGRPILRVLVTHMHPDHVGLAHWLCERWNAPLWMSATDYYAARLGSQCTSGYGHAPEHIALHCPTLGLLLGGDMMLPRISTNVSVFDIEPESNPLKLFLDSVDRFATLPADTLTLPSHGKPFRGLQQRIRQLHEHHRDRLEEVLQACQEGPCCGADILPVMFKRPLDLHQTSFAMGEAVAHLHALWCQGLLRRALGADGIYRFSAAGG